MSINKIKTTPGFCVLPFIEKHMPQDKTKQYYCCYNNGTAVKDRQKELTKIYAGEKIEHCTNCYNLEEQGSISPRQIESFRWLKDPDVNRYINEWSINAQQKIFFYDIRYNNKCNLACISCGPFSSSLWQKELGIEILQEPIVDVSLNELLDSKKIYMAGGEPFIIDRFLEIIDSVSNSENQPEVVINTNLTKINNTLISTLSKIKKLSLIISVDSFERVNEYHRWPMSWQKFLNNLNEIGKLKCYKSFNTVVDAVSILNIGNLIELENQIDEWNLSVLHTPVALRIENLPEPALSKARESVSQLVNSKFYKSSPVFKSRVNYILKQLENPADSDKLINYIKTIDARRNISHQDYLGVKIS